MQHLHGDASIHQSREEDHELGCEGRAVPSQELWEEETQWLRQDRITLAGHGLVQWPPTAHSHKDTPFRQGQLDSALPVPPTLRIFVYVLRVSLTTIKVSMRTHTHEWKPKDIAQERGLSFYHMGPREGTPTVGSKCLYQLESSLAILAILFCLLQPILWQQ